MKRFRLLKQTRQSTEYSCGASSLQAVLSYWGKDLDEEDLITLLHTTPETGTYPDDIVRVALMLGFKAEVKENLTLDEVEEATAQGIPVIVLSQAWRSRQDSAASVEEDWQNGHYVVVLAVDKDYVYYEDPYVRMGKGFMPRETFARHWHHVMGGDLQKGPKLIHLGIFIRGERPAQPQRFKEVELAKLDFGKMGSMNLLVTQFQGALLPYDFVNEIKGLWETGVLRPDVFFFLRKDKEGRISAIEGGRLQDEENVVEINALIAAIAGQSAAVSEAPPAKAESAAQAAREGDFGLGATDIQKIAGKLPPDHSAVIVLFENVWEKTFKETAGKYHGSVTHQRIIPSDALARLVQGQAETGRLA
ncbi:C39 family peptidase [Methylomicrobium lacus]|uniref:C39 family peptidase n=1 Tax=Methylomicrobium lacus TaxID=136992 RepID=UPI0035A98E94